jgi:hypothetical protein
MLNRGDLIVRHLDDSSLMLIRFGYQQAVGQGAVTDGVPDDVGLSVDSADLHAFRHPCGFLQNDQSPNLEAGETGKYGEVSPRLAFRVSARRAANFGESCWGPAGATPDLTSHRPIGISHTPGEGGPLPGNPHVNGAPEESGAVHDMVMPAVSNGFDYDDFEGR